MGFDASKVKYTGGGTPQEPLEAGVYPGRLVQLIDYGLQAQMEYKGTTKPPAYQIGLTYELSDEFMKDEDGEDILEKPLWKSEIVNQFSLEADKAKSTQRYLALDPDKTFGGNFVECLGKPVNISLIVEEGKKGPYNKVAALAAMRPKDAAKCPELVNEPRVFSLDEPDLEMFESFPDWIKDKIKGNLEFAGSPLDKLLNGTTKQKEKKSVQTEQQEEPAFDSDEDDDVPY